MSTAFFAEPGKPVIWRGAMLNSMMNNFFYEVNWSPDLDYMVLTHHQELVILLRFKNYRS